MEAERPRKKAKKKQKNKEADGPSSQSSSTVTQQRAPAAVAAAASAATAFPEAVAEHAEQDISESPSAAATTECSVEDAGAASTEAETSPVSPEVDHGTGQADVEHPAVGAGEAASATTSDAQAEATAVLEATSEITSTLLETTLEDVAASAASSAHRDQDAAADADPVVSAPAEEPTAEAAVQPAAEHAAERSAEATASVVPEHVEEPPTEEGLQPLADAPEEEVVSSHLPVAGVSDISVLSEVSCQEARAMVSSLGEASNVVESSTTVPERQQEAAVAATVTVAPAFTSQVSYERQEAAAAASAPIVMQGFTSPIVQHTTVPGTMMQPLSEVELDQLYQNPLLTHNDAFIKTFLSSCQQQQHPLHQLISDYLRHRHALANINQETVTLKKEYRRLREKLWAMEPATVTQGARCLDGRTVEYTHQFMQSSFNRDMAFELSRTMKDLRESSHEKRSMEAYEAQLSWLHVEQYLFKVVNSSPMFRSVRPDSPVTAWAVMSQSEDMVELRHCISVLFGFERRPIADEVFVQHLRDWTGRMVSLLLRVATLSDHLFLLNHTMRCPAGIARWATSFLQVLPPQLVHQQASVPHPTGVLVSYSQYSQPLMDLFVTVVATLLNPIQERNDMLSALFVPETPDSPSRNFQSWTLIDEDGEDVEDETPSQHRLLLSEADYTALFEQLPFIDMFKYILKISSGADGSVVYNISDTCSHDMLTLLAFTTRLLRLLARSFDTLTQARYRQFNKRVGRSMRLMVQFVADHWMAYVDYRRGVCHQAWEQQPVEENSYGMPRHSLQRLQLEFDEFFCRALVCILATQKMNRWQVISGMPYACLSPEMLWQIFWLLHDSPLLWKRQSSEAAAQAVHAGTKDVINGDNWRSFIFDREHREVFVNGLALVNPGEAIFLLTTFANMARGCRSDPRFVEAVVLDVFELGYLTPPLVEFLSRSARDTFNSISAVHPFVISVLLQRVSQDIEAVAANAMLLFNTLPMERWVPVSADVQLLQDWLLGHHPDTTQCQLARRTLALINWRVVKEGSVERLAVPVELHYRVAVLIVEALSQWAIHADGKGVMAASQFSFHQSLSAQQQAHLTQWAWRVVLGLRLHANERPSDGPPIAPVSDAAGAAARVPSAATSLCPWLSTREVPSLRESSNFVVVHRLLSVSKLAIYVGLSACGIGHSCDAFLDSGMSMLSEMSLTPDTSRAVIRVLSNSLPMFFLQPEVLTRHPLLAPTLMTLLQDRVPLAEQYMYMFWSSPTVSDTIKLMKAMVQAHIRNATSSGAEDAVQVTHFWLAVLTSLPNWNENRSALILLDGLVSISMECPKCRDVIRNAMVDLIKNSLGTPKKQGLFSSLFGGNAVEPPSLIATNHWPSVPWLAFAFVDAEEHFEIQCGLHDRLLKVLRHDTGISVEGALQDVFPTSTYPSQYTLPHWRLAIYRWAGLLQETPSSHPVHPLICQRFFALFLERRAPCEDEHPNTPRSGQGQRFFDSVSDRTMLRSVKQKLRSCFKEHNTLAGLCAQRDRSRAEQENEGDAAGGGEEPDIGDEQLNGRSCTATAAFYDSARRLYQTMDLWLDEPRLHMLALHLASLPPQYEPQKLHSLIECDRTLWQDYLDASQMAHEIEEMERRYSNLKCSHGVTGTTPLTQRSPRMAASSADMNISSDTPSQRIEERLGRHGEAIVAAPTLCEWKDPVPAVRPSNLRDSALLLEDVRENFSIIYEAARLYLDCVSRHTALDLDYMEAVQQLYTNNLQQIVKPTTCTSRINPAHRCLGPASIQLMFREATINDSVRQRVEDNRDDAERLFHQATGMLPDDLFVSVVRIESAITELICLKRQGETVPSAIPLFFSMVKLIDDTTKFYPPTRQFFASCIDILGQEYIASDPSQSGALLDVMMSSPALIPVLSSLFYPNRSPVSFGPLYSAIANSLSRHGTTDIFSLMSKFDVHAWLAERRPMMSDRSKFISSIGIALQACGFEPTDSGAVLSDLLRRQLRHLLLYRFPEHYSDVLHVALNGSAVEKMSLSSWSTFLSSIGCNVDISDVSSLVTPPPGTKALPHTLVRETMVWLGEYFVKEQCKPYRSGPEGERHQTGAFYANWRKYIPTLTTFMLFLSKTDVDLSTGAPEQKMSAQNAEEALSSCFERALSMFNPWIHCLRSGSSDASSASVNRSRTPPWREDDGLLAANVFEAFSEGVLQMQRSFHACAGGGRDALSLLWNHYNSVLSLTGTPLAMLQTYHSRLLEVDWRQWVPTLQALDGMLELHNDHPRECFLFLGRVLPLLDWTTIIRHYKEACRCGLPAFASAPMQLHAKMLRLLALLCGDPTVMQDRDSQILVLMEAAVHFDWHVLPMSGFQPAIQWIEDVGNPASILNTDASLNYILRILYGAAEFSSSPNSQPVYHEDAPDKRLSYLEYKCRQLVRCSQQPSLGVQHYGPVLATLFGEMETAAMRATDPEGVQVCLRPVFELLNLCSGRRDVCDEILNTVLRLMSNYDDDHDSAFPTPRPKLCMAYVVCACQKVQSPRHMVIAVETCITSHFQYSKQLVAGEADDRTAAGWVKVLESLSIPNSMEKKFIDTCVGEGAMLCLYADLLQRLPLCSSLLQELTFANSVLSWCSLVQIKTGHEAKMVLLWSKLLELLCRQVGYGTSPQSVTPIIKSLLPVIFRASEDKASEGILGAIGLGKRSALSVEFRLFGRALSAFVACQVLTNDSLRLQANAPGHPRVTVVVPGNATPALPKHPAAQLAQKYTASLESLRSKNDYNLLGMPLSIASAFSVDPQRCLMDVPRLISTLCTMLFPREAYLKILSLAPQQE